MKYENPSYIERSTAEVLLSHGSEDEVREVLVAIAFNESDWVWVQEKCLEFSRHPSWSVRAVATTCLGHLARIHHTLDLPRVLERLKELRADPLTADYAEHALEDIKRYIST